MPLRRLSDRTRDRLLLVWIVVFTGLTFYAIGSNRQVAEEGQEAHDALCVFRGDLERRYELGLQFVADNPNGIPGLPRRTLDNSLAGQKRTIDALETLDCSDEEA